MELLIKKIKAIFFIIISKFKTTDGNKSYNPKNLYDKNLIKIILNNISINY